MLLKLSIIHNFLQFSNLRFLYTILAVKFRYTFDIDTFLRYQDLQYLILEF